MGLIRFAVDETFHVVWAVRLRGHACYIHAIGDGAKGNWVTSDFVEQRFFKGGFRSPWLPIPFVRRAMTAGDRAWNCWTAFGRAARRGCFYFWV
jgi:hypothetical protein